MNLSTRLITYCNNRHVRRIDSNMGNYIRPKYWDLVDMFRSSGNIFLSFVYHYESCNMLAAASTNENCTQRQQQCSLFLWLRKPKTTVKQRCSSRKIQGSVFYFTYLYIPSIIPIKLYLPIRESPTCIRPYVLLFPFKSKEQITVDYT